MKLNWLLNVYNFNYLFRLLKEKRKNYFLFQNYYYYLKKKYKNNCWSTTIIIFFYFKFNCFVYLLKMMQKILFIFSIILSFCLSSSLIKNKSNHYNALFCKFYFVFMKFLYLRLSYCFLKKWGKFMTRILNLEYIMLNANNIKSIW